MKQQSQPVAPDYIKAFEQLGFGMFVHYGLYSAVEKGEWALSILKLDPAEYEKLAQTFAPGSMAEIVSVAKSAGCKYITMTTRHHEGFSLYDTCGLSDYDAVHAPACKRDVIREFVDECRKAQIVPVFYHTTLDWHRPEFRNDFDAYLEYLYKSVEILCTRYGKIGGLWFDGNWSKPDADWQEDKLYKMIHHYQPEAIIVNNTGLSARGAYGTDEIDAVTYERGMAEPRDQSGRTKYVAGEMCQTLNDHWGVGKDINFKPVKQLIEELCSCRKVGANFLLNIGPKADASVPLMQKAIMDCIGQWMQVYGTAIYNGRPYLTFEDRKDFVLKDAFDPKTAYLFQFDPVMSSGDKNVSLSFGGSETTVLEQFPDPVDAMEWMDTKEPVPFRQEGSRLLVNYGGFPYGTSFCVRVAKLRLA